MKITSIQGDMELLTGYTNFRRVRKMNGDNSISFTVPFTSKNMHTYNLVDNESIVEYDGQEYRIKDMTEVYTGSTSVKQVQATHIFFDLVDKFVYSSIPNPSTVRECLGFLFHDTGFTYEVVGIPERIPMGEFGKDNALSLFMKTADTYDFEFRINKKNVTIVKRWSNETDFQMRYGHNITALSRNINTNNLSTIIKGFGKKNEDGTYIVEEQYLSPNWTVFGLRDAPAIYDERFTDPVSLIEYIKGKIIDEPVMIITLDGVELEKTGIQSSKLFEGDSIYIIYEPLNINITARVMEIVDFDDLRKPPEYVIGNRLYTFTGELANWKNTSR